MCPTQERSEQMALQQRIGRETKMDRRRAGWRTVHAQRRTGTLDESLSMGRGDHAGKLTIRHRWPGGLYQLLMSDHPQLLVTGRDWVATHGLVVSAHNRLVCL